MSCLRLSVRRAQLAQYGGMQFLPVDGLRSIDGYGSGTLFGRQRVTASHLLFKDLHVGL